MVEAELSSNSLALVVGLYVYAKYYHNPIEHQRSRDLFVGIKRLKAFGKVMKSSFKRFNPLIASSIKVSIVPIIMVEL
jgi:hypothetical protein